MSLILCPECGSKISDRAVICPHCGYMSDDHTLPISVQDKFEVTPVFKFNIEEWNPKKGQFRGISVKNNKTLVEYLGNWKNIQIELPAIAKVIRSMAEKQKILVADMDKYIKKLIDVGDYIFTIDKNGNILPTIKDESGRFVKQVRLKEVSIYPELDNALDNLSTHAAMAQILDEIESVGRAIQDIHIELQNDRIAFAESAKDKLLLASKIQDTKIRETAILNAVSTATEAKRRLMRNFSENLKFVSEKSEKNFFEQIIKDKVKNKEINQKVEDAFQDLISITNTVQIECYGYAMIDEYESSSESLLQFKTFITDNKLNDRDTLLLLNENISQENIDIVNEFMMISDKITSFNAGMRLNAGNKVNFL